MDLYIQLNEISDKQDKILELLQSKVNNKSDCEDAIYDLTDLEQKLKISRRTLFKHLSSGVLEHTKIGKKIYVSEEQLQKFLNQNDGNYGRK